MQLTLGNCSPFSKMGREDLFKRGDDDSYGFDLQGVLSIHIHG